MQKTPTCILIDDDMEEHELFAMALSDMTFKVTCSYFTRCYEARKYLESEKTYSPNFAFVDWSFSYIEGNDCVADLQTISKLQTTKIFIYSGMHNNGKLSNYLVEHNVLLLEKQNSISELTKELEMVLR